MTKTWLIRRAVRRPVLDDATARISSSVCRLPFISSSPLAWWMSSTRLGGRLFAVRRVDDLETADVEACCAAATAAILARGPTRIGTMIPSSAASIAPRSDVSSHGWTTMVVAGGTCLARAINRSYLACGVCATVLT